VSVVVRIPLDLELPECVPGLVLVLRVALRRLQRDSVPWDVRRVRDSVTFRVA
jgi:hypothetical protein